MNYIFFIVLLFYPFTSPSLLCITDAAFEETLLEEESNPLLYDSSHSLSEGESIAVDDSAVRAAPAPPSVAESAVAPQVHPPEEAESYIRSRKDERKQMREQRREQRREFKLQRNSERAIPHLPGQLERTFLEEAAKGLRETGAEEEIRKQVVEYLHASKGSGERPSLDGALEYVYSISLEKGVPANEPAKEYLRGEGTYSITSGDVERNPVAAARKAVITGRIKLILDSAEKRTQVARWSSTKKAAVGTAVVSAILAGSYLLNTGTQGWSSWNPLQSNWWTHSRRKA